jgi:hypothetical protein
MALLALRVLNLSRSDQGGFIRLRYQSLLIEIQDDTPINTTNAIDVTTIEDLAKLAEKFNSMILHSAVGGQHTYYVQGLGSTYRFEIPININQPEVDSGINSNVMSSEGTPEEGNQ